LADYLILSTESVTKQKHNYDIMVVTTGKTKDVNQIARMVSVWINVTVIGINQHSPSMSGLVSAAICKHLYGGE